MALSWKATQKFQQRTTPCSASTTACSKQRDSCQCNHRLKNKPSQVSHKGTQSEPPAHPPSQTQSCSCSLLGTSHYRSKLQQCRMKGTAQPSRLRPCLHRCGAQCQCTFVMVCTTAKRLHLAPGLVQLSSRWQTAGCARHGAWWHCQTYGSNDHQPTSQHALR